MFEVFDCDQTSHAVMDPWASSAPMIGVAAGGLEAGNSGNSNRYSVGWHSNVEFSERDSM
jgi:hypothetical protein